MVSVFMGSHQPQYLTGRAAEGRRRRKRAPVQCGPFLKEGSCASQNPGMKCVADNAAGASAGHGVRWRGPLLAVAVAAAAVSLRPAVSSVGPVLQDIRADLGLSAAEASLLTTLPALCFGAGALVAPRLGRRFGSEVVLAVVFAVTTCGLAFRVSASSTVLFGGTFVAGSAIAVANVLLPATIKRDFPRSAGTMMGVYLSVTLLMSAVSAGVTVPIAQAFGDEWRVGLGAWAVPAAVAFVLWLAVATTQRGRPSGDGTHNHGASSLLRDRVAWSVTVFMGLQALVLYTVLAWLPSVYRAQGASPETAGHLVSLSVLIGAPTALFVPRLMARWNDQTIWGLAPPACVAAGLAGLLLMPGQALWLWATLIGIGAGTAFPVALTLVVLRSRDANDAARLSAMSQSVGYTLAATGPLLFGFLNDLTDSWTVPLLLLLVLLVPQAAAGFHAGRPLYVRDTKTTPRYRVNRSSFL